MNTSGLQDPDHPQPGQLVQVQLQNWSGGPPGLSGPALVLELWPSNELERATCLILLDGKQVFVECRDCIICEG